MANLSWNLRKNLTSLQGSVLLLITTVNFTRFWLMCHSLSTVEFTTCDVLKIIRNLNPNKAHGHGMISILMLKICDESICKPLGVIFWSCLQNGKKPMWFLSSKNQNKQEVKNCRHISLMPVLSEIFESSLYDSMFKFSTEHS